MKFARLLWGLLWGITGEAPTKDALVQLFLGAGVGDLYTSDIVATLDDGVCNFFGEVAMDPVVNGRGGEVVLFGDLGHGEHVGALEVFQDFLAVVTVVAAIVGGGGADLGH